MLSAKKLSPHAADPSASDANQNAQADSMKTYQLPEYIQYRDRLTRDKPRRYWRSEALCNDAEGLPWHETRGNRPEAPEVIQNLCEPCPVRQDCILDALRMPKYGMPGWRAGYRSNGLEALRAEAATRGIHVHAQRLANGKALTPPEVDEYIADRRADGASLLNIARELNEGSFPPPARAEAWTVRVVSRALDRMAMAPSVTEETEDLADELLQLGRAVANAKHATGLLESLGIDPEGLEDYLDGIEEPSDDELAELEEEGLA